MSNAFGMKNWPRISMIGKSTLMLALIYGILCCIFFVSFNEYLPFIFNKDTEVVQIATALLVFAAIFQISDALQTVSAGLLRGIKDVNIPTIFIAIAYWVLGIPGGYILAFKYNLKANGIWLGFIIGLSFSALFLTWRFLRRVKKHRV